MNNILTFPADEIKRRFNRIYYFHANRSEKEVLRKVS